MNVFLWLAGVIASCSIIGYIYYKTKPSERDQYLGVMLGVFCFLPLINIFIAVAGLFYLFLDWAFPDWYRNL